MSKLYEQKEELIIIKYGITKQELAAAMIRILSRIKRKFSI